jgi:peptide-methionine (S)-S-oxide reductase
METIVLGGGCFWCIEAALRRVRGVSEVVSGYAGGHIPNPDYYDLHRSGVDHAEVVQVQFDPVVISLHDLLVIFFTIHDPTTFHRQGADVGPIYRSMVLFTKPDQEEVIQQVMTEMTEVYDDPLTTEVRALQDFWPAEERHRQYYENHENQPYCQIVIAPKLGKLRAKFAEYLVD